MRFVQRGAAVRRATLLYNPNAGTAIDPDAVASAIGDVGFDVRTVRKAELDEALVDPGDVVVVAGGDGTVALAARRLAGTGVGLVVLPSGTANNIGRALGLDADLEVVLRTLDDPHEVRLDLGRCDGLGWHERFVEGVGVGAFAHLLTDHASKKDKQHDRALALLRKVVDEYAPQSFGLNVDGEDLSDRFLLVAAMNVCCVGPNLALAPDACFDDGQLDLVLARADQRSAFLEYLDRRLDGEHDAELPFERRRARHVRIEGDEHSLHIDASGRTLHGPLDVGVVEGAVRVWLPPPPVTRAATRRSRVGSSRSSRA